MRFENMLKKIKDKSLDIFLDRFDIIAILGLGVFFGIGGFSRVPRFSFFAFGFLFGALLGFAALPVFDSDKWTLKPLICAVLGALLTVAFAMFSGWSITNIFVGGTAGLILGYFAPVWAKYM